MRTPLLPEQELISLLKAKDKKGFDLLYNLYSKTLYNITFKIVHSKELAEDVLQDSFVKIWKNIHTYDLTKGSLFTFILNITRNTAIDKTRSLAYRSCSYFFTFDITVADKQTSIGQQTDFIGMDTFLSQLSPSHQALVDLVYMQGYTQEEAAKILHIPLGTAKSRLKAAITQLKGIVI